MPFRNFTFRTVLLNLAAMVSTLLPLYFVIKSSMTEDAKLYILLILAIANLAFIIISAFINHNSLISPLRKIDNTAKNITGGDYSRRIDFKPYDSELINLTESLNKMADAFENLEQMRKSFIANASHELRSPLTSIRGFLQAILDGTIAPEDSNKYLEIVLNETRRLSGMVNSMLDLSRLESGSSTLNLAPFELNETIRQLALSFQPILIKKAMQMGVNFAAEPCVVFADKGKIEQVLVNLVDNAIKYSPNNSKIYVSTKIHQGKVFVQVKDRGVGIAKKDLNSIWDRFYMADKARTHGKQRGTGLGLSIVKKIIEEHDEMVRAESAKGQGSTFIFSLSLNGHHKSQRNS